MTLTQVWGALLIFLLCPILGGLPLIKWITYRLTGIRLSQVGSGNISVSAAFYHGGKLTGILAVLSEASKGIIAVLLARIFFPTQPIWELIALIALVMGRYWMTRGAGMTNVVWGIIVHNPVAAGLIFVISGVGFTIFRHRETGKLLVLILLPLILSLLRPHDGEYLVAAITLAGLLWWIMQKIPDDLDLPTTQVNSESKTMFRFFSGNQSIISLKHPLNPEKVGQKAANLAQLKHWGYSIPDAWILMPGEDPKNLPEYLQPTPANPLVVRSSAIGEDTNTYSAAGQYSSILNVTNRDDLEGAILDCLASYHNLGAIQYRRDKLQKDTSMAVIIQKQIQGIFSGVAFSRDPIIGLNNCVVIEALLGDATQVVSGQFTPDQYRVFFSGNQEDLNIEGDGEIPPNLIKLVAKIAREIEDLYHGIPQDLEWTYDGNTLWLLQARPITNLQPIWTRKIAAEVIPGFIKPLTWSINRDLTCDVWGELFTLVLGKRSQDLDFRKTATLHYHRAYFNASLLGEIFLRMGLPPESLEFLTRGAKFSKPPIFSTLKNVFGLLRLARREWNLEEDFESDYRSKFEPTLRLLTEKSPQEMLSEELFSRIELILSVLTKATYYSILAPLSLSLRQAILKVSEEELDNSQTPEIKSMRSLASLAADASNLLSLIHLESYYKISPQNSSSLFAYLAEMPDGESILEKFQVWLEKFGYLSDVATDITVPRWKEEPRPVRTMFTKFLFEPKEIKEQRNKTVINLKKSSWQLNVVQKRLNLKGKVTEIYSKLLANLRWSLLGIGEYWQQSGLLEKKEDLYFLEIQEIEKIIKEKDRVLIEKVPKIIKERRAQLEKSKEITSVPNVVYGKISANAMMNQTAISSDNKYLQGIGASPGLVEGKVRIFLSLSEMEDVDSSNIVVVPYTDSGWTPLLMRAGGIIAEVGGRLSHGAIIAREYEIPAVMDVTDATSLLKNGQFVRLDGHKGVVEILD